jgi:hypothetical protein
MLAGVTSSLVSGRVRAEDLPKWTKIAEGGFPARDSGFGFQYDGKLWISNGYRPFGAAPLHDLLCSDDGASWQTKNAKTPYLAFSPISSHSDGWIYVVDEVVRRTKDGVRFETWEIPNMALFEGDRPMFSMNGKLHIVGRTYVTHFDPKKRRFSWTPLPWAAKSSYSFLVKGSRAYIIGGGYDMPSLTGEKTYLTTQSLNEVWSTDNPENIRNWSRAPSNPPWKPRLWPAVCAHNGYIYMTGGYDNVAGENLNDTWKSENGERWLKVDTDTSYPARHASTAFSRNGKLLLLAGNTNIGNSVQNDVWTLEHE